MALSQTLVNEQFEKDELKISINEIKTLTKCLIFSSLSNNFFCILIIHKKEHNFMRAFQKLKINLSQLGPKLK